MTTKKIGDIDRLDSRCPYRGLHVFDEEHAEFFFGREADIERMLETLRESRFLMVIGPSGSGKSSVVRAGLIPALRRDALQSKNDPLQSPDSIEFNSQQWYIQLFKPGRRPLEAMAFALKAINPAILAGCFRYISLPGSLALFTCCYKAMISFICTLT